MSTRATLPSMKMCFRDVNYCDVPFCEYAAADARDPRNERTCVSEGRLRESEEKLSVVRVFRKND